MLVSLQEEELFFGEERSQAVTHISNTYGKIKITQGVFVKYQES